MDEWPLEGAAGQVLSVVSLMDEKHVWLLLSLLTPLKAAHCCHHNDCRLES